MALNEFSLPIDIPWKRMAVSADMLDPAAGDLRFPEKWRSSIAVFYHEPTELPPDYCNRKITYLKITCTLTNYQLYGPDVTILEELRQSYGEFYAWKNFESNLTQSFPCHGALLQVATFPSPSDNVPLHDFPYISAFQPRKRELYETLSESGEVGSQSASRVSVGKQFTNSDTTETFDVLQGYSSSDNASVLFGLGAGGGSSAIQGQWGTNNRAERQEQHVTTADASRERRENHSYSTSVNQLYTILQGYHLGTNRALFFMQPRPHMQDSKFTFVRGFRRLEGIQEFFLIVDRPASVPALCVEVALETAHLYLFRYYEPRLIPRSDLFVARNLEKTAAALGLDPANYRYHTGLVATWNSFSPWVRALTHESVKRDPGFNPAQIQRLIDAGQMTLDQWASLREVGGHLPEVGVEEIALIFDDYEADNGWMFVTGRRLRACTTPVGIPTFRPGSVATNNEDKDGDDDGGNVADADAERGRDHVGDADAERGTDHVGDTDAERDVEHHENHGGGRGGDASGDGETSRKEHISTYDEAPSVTFEDPFYAAAFGNTKANAVRLKDHALSLNVMTQQVNETLWSSLGSSRRAGYGTVSFLETEFILDELAQLLRLRGRGLDGRPLEEMEGLRPWIERGLGSVSQVRSVFDIGQLSTNAVARDLQTTEVEAKKARRAILTAALVELPSIDVNDVQQVNPVDELFSAQYPAERLKRLQESALLVQGPPTSPPPHGPFKGRFWIRRPKRHR